MKRKKIMYLNDISYRYKFCFLYYFYIYYIIISYLYLLYHYIILIIIWDIASRDAGACDCKRDRLWVPFPLGETSYVHFLALVTIQNAALCSVTKALNVTEIEDSMGNDICRRHSQMQFSFQLRLCSARGNNNR